MLDFANPLILCLVLPFTICVLAMGLVRYGLGEGRGHVLASAAVSVAFLLGLLAYAGLPDWPGVTLMDQVFFLALAALMIGALTDHFPRFGTYSFFLQIALFISAIFWLFGSILPAQIPSSGLFSLGALTIIGVCLFLKLEESRDVGLQAPVTLAAAGLGLTAIGWIAGIEHVEYTLLIFLSALGGYLFLNMFQNRFPFAASAHYPALLILMAAALEINMVNSDLTPALLAVAGVFFAQNFLEFLPGHHNGPVARFIATAAPLAVAILISLGLKG